MAEEEQFDFLKKKNQISSFENIQMVIREYTLSSSVIIAQCRQSRFCTLEWGSHVHKLCWHMPYFTPKNGPLIRYIYPWPNPEQKLAAILIPCSSSQLTQYQLVRQYGFLRISKTERYCHGRIRFEMTRHVTKTRCQLS
jgi:hypothetical protein